MEIELWHWGVFGIVVTVLLALDLFVFNAEAHEPTLRESALLTVFWTSLALIFNGIIFWWLGADAGQAFFLGYVVEWSLSMDNVFIFFLVFTFFGVPMKYQHRVLFWGIIGAVVMRLTFVVGATALIHWVEWILPLFGAFLVFTGFKMLFMESEVDPEENFFLKLARSYLPVAEGSHGEAFFVTQAGKTMVTSLFLVLLVVESTDLIFAVDSVPTIIGVIDSYPSLKAVPSAFMFIAFTSNVFAILGLRSLYFLLAGSAGLLRYLNFGLSAVLIFIGGKMIAEYIYHHWFREPESHAKLIEPWVSLVVIVGVLTVAVVASVIANYVDPPSEKEKEEHSFAAVPHDPHGEQAANEAHGPSA